MSTAPRPLPRRVCVITPPAPSVPLSCRVCVITPPALSALLPRRVCVTTPPALSALLPRRVCVTTPPALSALLPRRVCVTTPPALSALRVPPGGVTIFLWSLPTSLLLRVSPRVSARGTLYTGITDLIDPAPGGGPAVVGLYGALPQLGHTIPAFYSPGIRSAVSTWLLPLLSATYTTDRTL